MLTQLAKEVHAEACAKGFHTSHKLLSHVQTEAFVRIVGPNVAKRIEAAIQRSILGALCMNQLSEIAELWEAFRKGNLSEPCDKAASMREIVGESLTCLEEECADIVIRALDFCADVGIDVDRAVRIKRLYNARRPTRNGNKAA